MGSGISRGSVGMSAATSSALFIFLTLKLVLPICVVFWCQALDAQVGRGGANGREVHSNDAVQSKFLVSSTETIRSKHCCVTF